MTNETKILTGIGIVTIIIITIAAFAFGGSSSSSNTTNSSTVVKKDPKILVRDDSHKIVAKGAKVTLVEFGDYQCPACGSAYPVVEQILSDYKGKITFVFRNFPLQVHKNSKIAAEAAEAAGAQGKYFDMYRKLYDKQKDWGENTKPIDYFVTYAKEIGLDVNKFKSDVENNKYDKKIQKDLDDGNAIGVNATPSFYINGVEQVGGLPYNEFKKKIDDAITAASPSKK